MDHFASGDRDFNVDLESGRVVDKSENEASVLIKSINHNKSEDPQLLASGRDERGKILGRAEMEEAGKEKCKKMSNKKPPRPPRPPRGPSLDAADQKLIREITEVAKLKRARMEKMRALKMANNARASSYSNKTVLALVFTVIVFLVVIFQGMSPKAEAPFVSVEGPSPESAEGLISVQYNPSLAVNYVNPPADASHYLVQEVAGSDANEGSTIRVAG